MPAVALSRAGARVVESGPGGEDLTAGAWQRLEALPDPRSPQGRIYLLACLIAVAVCAFTAAGDDRLTAVGQWTRRASQADLARLRAPWDPVTGQYRAPDEKTIRVVLDKLDPRALTQALLGPRRRRPRGRSPAGVRDYPARRALQEAKALARGGLRAVAVDGKTSRGARRADGTRVHLLGAAEHGGRLLDHLEVDIKHNETSHFTPLLEPLDLAGAVVTFDALHTVRANLNWLTGQKKAQYIAVVKKNQPLLHARVKALPWRQVPAGCTTRDTGHGRLETRTLKTAHVRGLGFPGARQAIKITRWRQDIVTRKISRETVYAITSLTSAQATAADLARLVREHWTIEAHHHIRSPGVPRLSYGVALGARRRASATHLRGCGARCRCCSEARCLGTGRLVQHLWRDYPVLINRRPGETRKTRRVSWFALPENIRDVTFTEDTATSRTGNGPANLATIRAAIIAAIKDAGYLHVPEGRRDHTTPADALCLHGLN